MAILAAEPGRRHGSASRLEIAFLHAPIWFILCSDPRDLVPDAGAAIRPHNFTRPQPSPCDNAAMRAMLILGLAIMLGLAGGYAWSGLGPGRAAPKPPKARLMALPASPEEQPAALDQQWTDRASDSAEPAAAEVAGAAGGTVYYPGCNAVRAAGKAPLHSGEPGYRIGMDGDGDGIACEPIRPR